MSVREYVGARYVPVFANPIEWNSANTYEPLTIVLHNGNSYTSRQAVPSGIDITNSAYWAQTGNYNAQIEQYRQDIVALQDKFPVSVIDGGTGGTDAAAARANLDAAQSDGASTTLYSVEQAIALNTGSIITLQNSLFSRDNQRISFDWREPSETGKNYAMLDVYIDSSKVLTFNRNGSLDNASFRKSTSTPVADTIPANSGKNITVYFNNVPTGFKPISVAGFNTGSPRCYFATINIISTQSKADVYIMNPTSQNQSVNIEITALCLLEAVGA